MPPRKHKRKRKPKPSPVGPAFEQLVGVMARLRAPNGCPWDREQTHSTLRTYLIEEAYEVLDALDSSDDAKFAEELGDLLLQVLFHAQIAREESRFDISTVICEIHEKLIRRHPHVFGNKHAKTSAEVLRNWEQIKKQERANRVAPSAPVAGAPGSPSEPGSWVSPSSPNSSSFTSSSSSTSLPSILDGVPRSLPALLEALQLTRKAARIGFDWHNLDGIFAKLQEETRELQDALAQPAPIAPGAPVALGESASPAAFSSPSSPSSPSTSPQIESELGDLLFVAVNLARFLHLDPEIALKKSSAKFSRRFRQMERLALAQGTTLAQLPRPQMESLWDQSKLLEHSAPSHKPTK